MRDLVYSFLLFFLSLTIGGIGIIKLNRYHSEKKLIPISSKIQSEFSPFVRDFIKDARTRKLPAGFFLRLDNLSIEFGNPNENNISKESAPFVAYCEINTTKITVDVIYWKASDFNERQSMIDHELGHCLLGRYHLPGEDNGDSPRSLMYSKIVPSFLYRRNKLELRNELFNNQPREQLIKTGVERGQ